MNATFFAACARRHDPLCRSIGLLINFFCFLSFVLLFVSFVLDSFFFFFFYSLHFVAALALHRVASSLFRLYSSIRTWKLKWLHFYQVLPTGKNYSFKMKVHVGEEWDCDVIIHYPNSHAEPSLQRATCDRNAPFRHYEPDGQYSVELAEEALGLLEGATDKWGRLSWIRIL